MINNIERTVKTLKHEKVDSLPRGELFLDRTFLDHFWDGLKDNYAQQLERAARSLGLQAVGVGLDTPQKIALLQEGAYRNLRDYFTIACINGPIARLIEQAGFFDAMRSLTQDLSVFSNVAAAWEKEIADNCRLFLENGFDAIAIADDIAGNGGLMFSYDFFIGHLLPCYRRFAGIARSNSLYAFFHSDGDTKGIIPPLIDATFDCLHTLDAQAGMDPYALKGKFGEKICFMGHIDVMAWDESKVRSEIARAEEEFENGGLILGSSCGISIEAGNNSLRALYPRWRK